MAGAVEGDYFVGRKAEERRGLLKIKYPLEHGVVKDWADMERIWNHTYGELRCAAEDVCATLFSFWLTFIFTASRSADGSAVKSKEEQRKGC